MSWKDKRKSEIDEAFECVKQKYLINKEDIISKSRKKPLVTARMILMNVLFEVFGSTDETTQDDISEIINRNRCSFIHHRKKHTNEYHRYKAYRLEYDNFKKYYKTKISNN